MTDNGRDRRVTVVLVVAAALLLPVALAVVGGWAMWSASRHPAAPEAGAVPAAELREALERAAETAMPVPKFLSADAVVIECPAGGFEQELQRVVRLATGVGGSASSWNDGTSVRIVAKVPESNAAMFRDALQRGVYDIAVAGTGKAAVIVEVLLKPAEGKGRGGKESP